MPLESRLYKGASCLVMVMFLLTSCAPTKTGVRVNEHERYGSLVYQRTFDEHGRPEFLLLSARPTETGEGFSLVEFEDNRPSVSFEIAIKDEPDKDFLKPVAGFFENLAFSLVLGLGLGLILYDEAEEEEDDLGWSPDEAFNTGFVIGAGGGILYTLFSAGNDALRLVTHKKEIVVSETYYSYDEAGRLKSMITMPPPGNQWESRTTTFLYDGEETVPSRTETGHNPALSPDPDSQ